jgi:hypothetical protein
VGSKVGKWHKASIGSVRAYVCSWGCTGNGRATVKLALLTQLGHRTLASISCCRSEACFNSINVLGDE